MAAKLYVFSGGPGVGKTSLLNYLQQAGYEVMPEVARAIIAAEIALGGNALPWGDKDLYINRMLTAEVTAYKKATNSTSRLLFLDRGVIDSIGYARLIGSAITPRMEELAVQLRYEKEVFILPPWREIYVKDAARKQDWTEAVDTYHILKQTYTDYGYRVVEVPIANLAERADFVMRQIGEKNI